MTFEKRAIGSATLYRGDSLELLRAGVFGKLGAIVSDPPYGIGYVHSGYHSGFGSLSGGCPPPSKSVAIAGDDVPFDPAPWIEAAPMNRSGHSKQERSPRILLWGADHFNHLLPQGGTLLAWDKHLGIGPDTGFADYEWAWCGKKSGRVVFRWLWKGLVMERSPLDSLSAGRSHVSQKPVELMRWCIDKVRPLRGLPVLDPYMGSGSTGIAALSLGLPFIGCEIDPTHFESACRRITEFHETHGHLHQPQPDEPA